MQKSLWFCTPFLETPQPVLPYCAQMINNSAMDWRNKKKCLFLRAAFAMQLVFDIKVNVCAGTVGDADNN